MRRNACSEGLDEVVEAEGLQVVLVHPCGAHLGELPDPLGFLAGREADPRGHQPLDASCTPGAREDEVDRRQHALLFQNGHHLFAARHVNATVPLARARDALVLRRPRAPAVVGLVPHLLAVERDDVRVRHQLALLLAVHRVQVVADEVVVLERDRPPLLDHDPRGPSERADPLAELLGVGDRGR
jgi:hypothetical protein